MAWLIYVQGLASLSPHVIFDGENKPLLSEGIRGRVVVGSERKLSADEAELDLKELAGRYPPPGWTPPPLEPTAPAPQPSKPLAPSDAVVADIGKLVDLVLKSDGGQSPALVVEVV